MPVVERLVEQVGKSTYVVGQVWQERRPLLRPEWLTYPLLALQVAGQPVANRIHARPDLWPSSRAPVRSAAEMARLRGLPEMWVVTFSAGTVSTSPGRTPRKPKIRSSVMTATSSRSPSRPTGRRGTSNTATP